MVKHLPGYQCSCEGLEVQFRRAIANGLITLLAVAGSNLSPAQATSPDPTPARAEADSQPQLHPITALPAPLPDPIAPLAAGITALAPGPNTAVGIGHLRPADLSPLEGDPLASNSRSRNAILHANWLQGIALPIYPSPNSSAWGWLINGWLIPTSGPPLAIGRDAAFTMVHTERQIYTFPVMELRPDGWFRFRYTTAGDAWSHTDYLNRGTIPLTLETWAAYLKDAVRVEFQRPGVAQPLRLAPSSNAPLQALVGPNSLIQPLDMEGDWLRVRVTQPVQGCTALPGANTAEGWVRWRNDADLTLLWFPDGDC
jgi:hypothetical protein